MMNNPPSINRLALQRDAEAGLSAARFNLGLSWLYGDGGPADPAQAWHWLAMAAGDSIADARATMGLMCLSGQANGQIGRFDVTQALEHLEAANADGSIEARFRLGTLLMTGPGIRRDVERGSAMVESAARQGHMLALNEAAFCLEHGIGLACDPARALRAWQLAAEADMPRAWFVLGTWLSEGRHVSADRALARACFDRAASRQYPLASWAANQLDGESMADPRLTLQLKISNKQTGIQARVERLSDSPRIELWHDFVPLEVRAHVIDRARRRIEPSRVLTQAGTLSEKSIRTSGETNLVAETRDICLWQLETRLHEVAGLPLGNGEPLIVLHYRPGAEYKPHYDYYDPSDRGHAQGLRHGGQRLVTQLCYLNAVAAGGETAFPELGLSVAPEPGAMLAFWNTHADGSIDPRTLHAGLPVEEGEKWLATRWIREHQFSREPADA